jgi:hypothetical protein
MAELTAGRAHPPLRPFGVLRRRTLAATALVALAVGACDQNLAMPGSIAEALDRGGLTLKMAWFAATQVTREAAIEAARDDLQQGNYDGTVTSVDLVTVSGPGNVRLGWSPADHPLAYAVQWTSGSSVGLVLVSARTGEVLLLTAY